MTEIAKDLSISLLLDFYGAMLTEKQREVVAFYYNEDLSLAEIAGLSGITRQGVRDSIKRAEKQLLECEEKLGLYGRFHDIQSKLEYIRQITDETIEENKKITNSELINKNLNKIIELTKEINI